MDSNCNYFPDIYIDNCSNKKLLDGILHVPLQKPPIETIIYTNIRSEILEIIPVDDTIILIGKLKIEIEYSADVPAKDQPVHYCHFDICFTHLICFKKHCAHTKNFCCKDITVVTKYKKFCEFSPKEICYTILLDFNFHNKINCCNCRSYYHCIREKNPSY